MHRQNSCLCSKSLIPAVFSTDYDTEFREAIDRASSPGVEFQIPEGTAARVDLLKEMVRMMGADGKITTGEKQLFAAAAATMKISDVGLNQIIDSAIE